MKRRELTVIESPAAEHRSVADSDRLMFVCGVGRSGTSLVQSMLAAHPDIAVLPETGFLRRYALGRVLESQHRRNGMESVIHQIDSDVRIEKLDMAATEIVAPFVGGKQRLTDIACYGRILELFAARHGKATIVDKDPRLIEFVPFLRRHFPRAHILHVVRDPRDVLVSKQKAAWSRGRPWWQHAFANRVQFEIGHRAGKRNFGERYQVILYEELLERPEAILSSVCEQIRLQFAPAMLDFQDAAKKLVRDDEMDWKRETTERLQPDNSGKWRESLTVFQTSVVERMCRPTMQFGRYQYSKRHRGLSPYQRSVVAAVGIAAPVLSKIYGAYRRATMGAPWS